MGGWTLISDWAEALAERRRTNRVKTAIFDRLDIGFFSVSLEEALSEVH
jgi:hypothetical protein